MAWTLTGGAADVGDGAVATVTIDTDPADLLVVFVVVYNGASSPTAAMMSDSAGNTWPTPTVQLASGDAAVRLAMFTILAPNVSNTHTITFNPNGSYPSMVALALSQGASSAASGSPIGAGGTGTTIQIGSVGAANDVVVEGVGWYTANGWTIDGSFSTILEAGYLGGTAMGAAASWKEVSGAVNPTWTASASESAIAGIAAAFTGVGGGAAGQPTMRRWGGVPHMGTGGLKGGSGGGPWGRSRTDRVIVPRWLADQERQAA